MYRIFKRKLETVNNILLIKKIFSLFFFLFGIAERKTVNLYVNIPPLYIYIYSSLPFTPLKDKNE